MDHAVVFVSENINIYSTSPIDVLFINDRSIWHQSEKLPAINLII